MSDSEKISFLPKPLPEWFDGELYWRMLNKEVVVEIDNESGLQALVLTEKTDFNADY